MSRSHAKAVANASRGAGESTIIKRRQREDTLSMYSNIVKGFSQMNSRADWEQKLHEKAGAAQTLGVFRQLKNQDESALVSRRLKLAALLNSEMEAWKEQCLRNVETVEQRKEKMIARATALKEKREAARRAFIEEKKLQQYRESCDDLRSLDSMALLSQTVEGREKQLLERERQLQEEKDFEAKMALLWEEDIAKKEERDRADIARMHTQNKEVKAILDVQVDLFKARVAEEAHAKEEEDKALIANWKVHAQMEAALDEERKQQAIARSMEVKRFNQKRADMSEREARREREYDNQLLLNALQKEAEAARREKALQEKFKHDALEYQSMLKKQMETEAEDLSYLDAIRKRMEDEVWAKRDREHNDEQAAREELLAQVLQSRNEQMERKAREKLQVAAEDAAFMTRVQQEADEALAKELREQEQRKMDAKRNQQDIVAQKRLAAETKAKEAQAAYLDMKRMHLVEKQHQQKVASLAAKKPVFNYRRKTSEWFFDT